MRTSQVQLVKMTLPLLLSIQKLRQEHSPTSMINQLTLLEFQQPNKESSTNLQLRLLLLAQATLNQQTISSQSRTHVSMMTTSMLLAQPLLGTSSTLCSRNQETLGTILHSRSTQAMKSSLHFVEIYNTPHQYLSHQFKEKNQPSMEILLTMT